MFHYFGYGSNMSDTALRAKGVEPCSARPAVLRGWRLAFDVPNFFPIEGCTGNIRPAPGAEVHGVLYECDDRFLSALDELEAVDVAYERRSIDVNTYAGDVVTAYVYVGIASRSVPEGLASSRYRNILVQGARSMGLDPTYVAGLERLAVQVRPEYPPFELSPEATEILSPEQLAGRPHHVALAGVVFDMTEAPPEHAYLHRLFSGRDVTLFFLRRMDSSDGQESLDDIVESRLTEEQRRYLDDYLHEFARVYRQVGRLRYGGVGAEVAGGRRERMASAVRAAHTFDPARALDHLDAVPARRVLLEAEQTNRRLGHENLGFLSEVHGFAPLEPPADALPSSHAIWDETARELSTLYRTLRLRRTVEALPVLPAGPDDLADEHLLRAAALIGMLSHAYWYVETRPPDDLPPSLALPWAELRRRLGREQEVLSYVDLIVYNWRLVDPTDPDPRRVENMRLAFPTVNNQEERVFYLTQFEILSRCSPIIGAVVRAQEAAARDDPEALETELHLVMEALQRVVRDSLLKINPNPHGPNYVDPVVWAKTVAPFAVPFRKGVQGPSGTSSPIFNLLDTFFGRRTHETFLGREIRDLRSGYPRFWRELIDAVGEVSIGAYVARVDKPWLSGLLRDAVQVYAGPSGFLGRHRMKVYGYLELAFKVGRSVTIGGFSGVFRDRTWDRVDSELEYSRKERMASFPSGAHRAFVREVRPTTEGGTQRVSHVVLDVAGAGVRYEAGDRCYVLPEVDPLLVERTLRALRASGDEECVPTAEWREALALRQGFDAAAPLRLRDVLRFGKLRPVGPRLAEALHAVTQSPTLLDAIREQTTERWELWDLLEGLRDEGFDPRRLVDAPADSSEHVTRVVPPEEFRAYSIASVMDDPDATAADEIHLTVGRVSYRGDDATTAPRHGTASSFLTDPARRGAPISVLVQHPPRFALPDDPRTPVVMIAGGTGISPFRAFALERARQPDAGPTWLVLGVRTREHLHYREELEALANRGKLRLEVALSREDPAEASLGPLIGTGHARVAEVLLDREVGADLLALLAETPERPGARVYLCGHSRFAKSVHRALKQLLMRAERGDEEERRARAEEVLRGLAAEGRYLFEIFTDARPWDRRRERIDVSDIVTHNDPARSAWIVVDGTVYDVTEFLALHPGGRTVLAGYAGMDATQGYLRAHAGRTEVDAMQAMYEIGTVRPLDFGEVRGEVVRDGVPQTVALAALHRGWTALAYLVVEMENALRADHSLQRGVTTEDEPVEPRSPYRLQRAVETHVRFLRSYLDPLSGPALEDVQLMTCGLLGDPRQAPALAMRLSAIRASEDARLGEVLPGVLDGMIDGLVERAAPADDPAWARVTLALTELEALDAALLADVKAALREGLRAFERHEAQTLSAAGETLISVLDSLVVRIEEYHRTVRWRLSRVGLIPTTIPPPAIRPEDARTRRTIVASSLWQMVEDTERRVLVLRRSAVPVISLEELVAQNDAMIDAMTEEHLRGGVVVDMRQAPPRNDPQFENAMRKLRAKVNEFTRVALLVTSASGMLQVNRLTRNEDARTTWATQSEDAALRFASGQS